MKKSNLKIIKGLIAKYGEEAAMNKVQEELLELALVIVQHKSPTKDSKKMLQKMYEEAADVKIVMRKLEFLLDKRKINRIVNKKLKQKQQKHLLNGNKIQVQKRTTRKR
jgi:NTP pyrophosphatase (non-canonical NTP hydrolase)